MNIKISTTIKSITAAVFLSILAIFSAAVDAQAMSFQTFVGVDTPEACDAYDAIFYDAQCVKGANGGGEVLGAQDKKVISVELLETRCVADDGVAEILLDNVLLYKLEHTTTGDITTQGSNVENGYLANARGFSDLADGEYVFSGRGDSGQDSVPFTIDCDSSDDGGEGGSNISAACSVTPSNPKVGEAVQWQAQGSGAGDYAYSWSGNVSGTQASESVTYSSSGEKEGYITIHAGSRSDVARCSVQVGAGEVKGDRDEPGAPAFSRTIEEF